MRGFLVAVLPVLELPEPLGTPPYAAEISIEYKSMK